MKRLLAVALVVLGMTAPAYADAEIERVDKRFTSADIKEVPNFRRHVVPLLGKLGCNGRACHGSFQGQGGFRLSLFGYDFKMDHDGLAKGDPKKDRDPRIDVEFPEESLALEKTTLTMPHKGGKRMDVDSWQYNTILTWIKGGAKNVDVEKEAKFERLEVTPKEMVFSKGGQSTQLKVVAVWSDGAREDVTPLCRFRVNDDQVAKIDEVGKVTSNKPGDTHIVVFYDNGIKPVPVIQPVSDKVGKKYPQIAANTKIDELVLTKLRKLGVVPSERSSDAEFLRRTTLDITGSLPAPQDIEAFLADSAEDKRSRKIDELLESPAYAAWWATKLSDFTGNNADAIRNAVPRGRGTNRTASHDWFEWLEARLAQNTPYDEVIERIVVAESRNPGESYTDFCKSMSNIYSKNPTEEFADRHYMPYYWARQNVRQPEEKAIAFAYSFLGIRIQCAQCHKHPFDQWTRDDFKSFRALFTGIQGYRRNNSRNKEEYDAILKELKIDPKLRGNQQRNALGRLLAEGKTVPFSETYATRIRLNNNARQQLARFDGQLERTKQQLAEAKKKGDKRQIDRLERQLISLPRRLQQLKDRAELESPYAKVLGGDVVDVEEHEDVRQPLMDWMKTSPLFARAFVNRVWANYFNVGIVEPTDDMSLANPPSNKGLLDYLTQSFMDSKFDIKKLHREIANSDTYQRSWKPNDTNVADNRNFSHSIPRRLPAEVAYDALKQATASDAKFVAMHKEMAGRAIAIPGASARYNNRNNNGSAYALSIFGRSIRDSNCDCDRSSDPTLMQTVYLQNDQEIYSMIDRGGWVAEVARGLGLRAPAAQGRTPRKPRNYAQQIKQFEQRIKKAKKQGNDRQVKQIQRQLAGLKNRFEPKKPAKAEKVAELDTASVVKSAYLRTLSRTPSDDELKRSQEYIAQSEDTLNGIRGLLWALLNTKEFIVNH